VSQSSIRDSVVPVSFLPFFVFFVSFAVRAVLPPVHCTRSCALRCPERALLSRENVACPEPVEGRIIHRCYFANQSSATKHKWTQKQADTDDRAQRGLGELPLLAQPLQGVVGEVAGVAERVDGDRAVPDRVELLGSV